MSAMGNLRKSLDKKGLTTEMNDPTEWISIGNAAMNFRLTGRYDVGLPNRRTLLLWGESGTGKTFLASNAVKAAQDKGYAIVYLDSEDSISEDYMKKIGVDMSEDMFIPVLVDTIEEATAAVSEIFSTMGEDDKFMLVIDSLAGLMSEKEEGEFDKGIAKGDQGQIAKRLKLLTKNINKKIADHDAFCVMVTHAYQNQDMYSSEGKWICTGGKGMQYFPSFSVRLDKAKLKDGATVLNGVRIKAEVTKTRFTAPFQKFELNVPYDKGLDFTDGLLDILEEEDIVKKNGAWYSYDYDGETQKFQASKFDEHYERIMENYQKELEEDLTNKEIEAE